MDNVANYCGILSFGSAIKKKRKHVKIACTNCRKAKAACSNERPCKRCVTYKIDSACVDSERKKPFSVSEGNYLEILTLLSKF